MGYGPGAWPAKGVYWTDWLMVHPDFRRAGVGSALSLALEQQIRMLKGRLICLDVGSVWKQADAVAFHVRHGYEVKGIVPDYWGDSDDLVIMSKRLSRSDRRSVVLPSPPRDALRQRSDIEGRPR